MNPLTGREIAEVQQLLGDLLAVGHTVEESATFLTSLSRGDIDEDWDGGALLW